MWCRLGLTYTCKHVLALGITRACQDPGALLHHHAQASFARVGKGVGDLRMHRFGRTDSDAQTRTGRFGRGWSVDHHSEGGQQGVQRVVK